MFDLPDSEILPLSKEHVFYTWSAQAKVNPIAVKRAEGVYFWDVNDKRYLDFNSMTMCVNVGHGNRRIIQAMQEQAAELPYAAPGMTTKIRALASQSVSRVTPGGRLSKILFTLGGADANENAIKLARGYSKRFKILTRYRSYHGATMGAMAATGDPRRHIWEPGTMPGVVHFLDPYRYRSTFHRSNPHISEADFTQDYLNHLEEIIRYEGPETIAAILMESVTGTNGIIIPPEGYMQGARALCDKYGIVMIADEVMSGFGRTGKWFAV
ncbi:MAG: aminotransferase class III-fold pyridoxal phosphate-dependent enzyme, partial [Chloroflexota bacterium]